MAGMALAAAWAAVRGFFTSNGSLALVIAAVAGAATLAGTVWLGIGRHDAKIERRATEAERQRQEIAALKQKLSVLQTYAARGLKARAELEGLAEAHREKIGDLEKNLKEARNASAATHDPRRPVFDADDPWLRPAPRGGSAGRAR